MTYGFLQDLIDIEHFGSFVDIPKVPGSSDLIIACLNTGGGDMPYWVGLPHQNSANRIRIYGRTDHV